MTDRAQLPHLPIRTCAGCGQKDTKAGLVRIVSTPESALVVDSHQRLPGRGVWLHPRQGCFARARKTGRLVRSIHVANASDESWAQVEDFFTARG